jgi:hypothetical protein
MNSFQNRAYRQKTSLIAKKTVHTYEWFSKPAFCFMIKLRNKSSETGVLTKKRAHCGLTCTSTTASKADWLEEIANDCLFYGIFEFLAAF